MWYKQHGPCLFWAWTFKTYWVTLSLSLPTSDRLKVICGGGSMTGWRIPGSTNALECCLQWNSLLCDALRFCVSYHRKAFSDLSSALPSQCLSATSCHPFWCPGSCEILLEFLRGQCPSGSLSPSHKVSDGVNTEMWTLFSISHIYEFFLSMSLHQNYTQCKRMQRKCKQEPPFSKRGEWGQWFSSLLPSKPALPFSWQQESCIWGLTNAEICFGCWEWIRPSQLRDTLEE